jgi:hypothetical protein
MKTQSLPIVLTVLNLVLLVFTLAQMHPAVAQALPAARGAVPVLRGRGLEIVDEKGTVRASLNVIPAGRSAAGDAYPETVLLRLITERGRPSVKISATEEGSGLSVAGPTGTSNTYLVMESKAGASSLRLRNENGREQVIKP